MCSVTLVKKKWYATNKVGAPRKVGFVRIRLFANTMASVDMQLTATQKKKARREMLALGVTMMGDSGAPALSSTLGDIVMASY